MGQGEKTRGLVQGRKRVATTNKKAIARTQRDEAYVHIGKSKPTIFSNRRVTIAIKKNVEDIMKARLLHQGKKLAILPKPKQSIDELLGYSGPSHGADAKRDRAQAGGARRAKELMEQAELQKRTKRKRTEDGAKLLQVEEFVEQEEHKRVHEKEVRIQNQTKKRKGNFYSSLKNKKSKNKSDVSQTLTNSWSEDL